MSRFSKKRKCKPSVFLDKLTITTSLTFELLTSMFGHVLEHLFCCIAINNPGNVEGALLAALGHLILCPP